MAQDEVVQCELDVIDYEDVIALWQRAGLRIHPAGRDSAKAFAAQQASGCQRVVGLRTVASTAGRAGEDVPRRQPGGTLVAVAVLTHDGRKGWINRLAVDPAYRRRGLAKALIAEAERWFTQDQGLEVWAALIEGYNQASQALFAALGYGRPDVVYVSKRMREDA